VGSTLHQKQAVTIVDLSELLGCDTDLPNKKDRQQMILLKTKAQGAQIALAVDELGEIPSLPMSAIHESESLRDQGGIIQGLIKTSDNVLLLLNSDHLLNRLNTSEKKPLV
ncbi:MAG: chemotaxis protein CheW, partial [Limnobacter sp.]